MNSPIRFAKICLVLVGLRHVRPRSFRLYGPVPEGKPLRFLQVIFKLPIVQVNDLASRRGVRRLVECFVRSGAIAVIARMRVCGADTVERRSATGADDACVVIVRGVSGRRAGLEG